MNHIVWSREQLDRLGGFYGRLETKASFLFALNLSVLASTLSTTPWVTKPDLHLILSTMVGLYDTQGTGIWHTHRGNTRIAPYTRAESDSVLKEGMADRAIGAWEQFVIWCAVRIGGRLGWARAPHRQPALEALDA